MRGAGEQPSLVRGLTARFLIYLRRLPPMSVFPRDDVGERISDGGSRTGSKLKVSGAVAFGSPCLKHFRRDAPPRGEVIFVQMMFGRNGKVFAPLHILTYFYAG